jgi:hypothetical protein
VDGTSSTALLGNGGNGGDGVNGGSGGTGGAAVRLAAPPERTERRSSTRSRVLASGRDRDEPGFSFRDQRDGADLG